MAAYHDNDTAKTPQRGADCHFDPIRVGLQSPGVVGAKSGFLRRDASALLELFQEPSENMLDVPLSEHGADAEMNSTDTAEIGKTGLRVTRLGLGAGPLGGLWGEVPRDVAHRVVQRAFELGVRYFDTAPWYGHGISETFVGETLSGLPRQEFALSTKVDSLVKSLCRSN